MHVFRASSFCAAAPHKFCTPNLSPPMKTALTLSALLALSGRVAIADDAPGLSVTKDFVPDECDRKTKVGDQLSMVSSALRPHRISS